MSIGKRLAAAAAAVALVAAGARYVVPRTQSAQATPTIVTLTSTLEVDSDDTYLDTRFVWQGPSTAPVVRLKGASEAKLEHVEITVATGYHATAAIQIEDDGATGSSANDIRDVKIGDFGAAGGFDYGVRWTTAAAASDDNTLTNVTVIGAGTAAVALDEDDATGNTFRSIFTFDTPIGFRSSSESTVPCENCGFFESTDVDVVLLDGAGMLLTGVRSEGSRAFARVTAGPAAGSLTVIGGYWEWGANAVGATITGTQPSGGPYPTSLRLQDFTVLPLGSTLHGSVTGFGVDEKLFSNVAGIA